MVAKHHAGWPLPFVVAAASLLMTTTTALPDAAYKTSPITKVVLLGTGTPGPDPERSGPCVAIVVNDIPYLVDLGPGVIRRASAAWLPFRGQATLLALGSRRPKIWGVRSIRVRDLERQE